MQPLASQPTAKNHRSNLTFLISNFLCVLNVVCFCLGNSPV
jgi:hypothetical protein